MATAGKNLSEYDFESIPDAAPFSFALVVSEWNSDITLNLAQGARDALLRHGVKPENLQLHFVPGSYELILGSQLLAESESIDAVIAIGSVIQGETPHFEFICEAVAQGIKDVNLKYGKPVIFCVLTDNNIQQARDRSGGKHGNKGVEAAVAAIKMAVLKKQLSQ